MNTKTSKLLYAYWNEVRSKRIAPRRFEIEPARIGTVLPDTFILERVEAGQFRFRIAGTRIVESFGLELRGSDFLDLWSPQDRGVVATQLATVTTQGGVGKFTFEASDGEGRRANFEALLLPLVHSGQSIDRIVGCMSCMTQPSWVGTVRLDQRRLSSQEIVWPDGRPYAVLARGESQAPFLPHMRGARLVRSERRQFRVYDGGLSKSDGDDR
jgi:hypothetical protein